MFRFIFRLAAMVALSVSVIMAAMASKSKKVSFIGGMDDNNKALVTDEMKAAVEKAKADIIAGKIQVHDYTTDNACPY